MKNYCKISRKYYGFSFIESMLSIFILSTAIVAALSLISVGIKHTTDSKNQQIAMLLAEEGVELVRNIRDNNWANRARFTTGAFTYMSLAGNYIIDYGEPYGANLTPVSSLNSNETKLYIVPVDGYYNRYQQGNPTSFRRIIILTPNVGNTTMTVTSVVAWGGTNLPTGAINDSTCKTSLQCTYSSITLTKWIGN